MGRLIRYQGAIVRNDQVLLIKHRERASGRSYWLFPGGGIEPGETPEECVRREMKEETGLDVQVVRLALDLPEPASDSPYRRHSTYLCQAPDGEPRPGYEPEPQASSSYAIVEVKWFDLRDEVGWDLEMVHDPFTYPQVQQLRRALGYLPAG